MEEKIIGKPNDLSIIEFKDLALSLRNGTYSILLSTPTEENMPEGIIKSFTRRDTYQYILDDPEANFECFALAFPSGKTSVVVPIGVYGVTAAHQVYFPLQLSAFGRAFIMMSFDGFNAIYTTNSAGDNKSKFALLLGVREELIERIFHYYYSLDEKFNSVMAWPARNPSSPTRKIAERMLFNRIEFGDINNRSEVYSTKDLWGRELSYLIECSSRWEAAFEAQHKSRSHTSNINLSIEKLSLFYQVIVD
jgi:hypothetical protein